MWTSAQIRRHICILARDALFTTRDFLSYGSRAAVDQALYRLVKQGEIVRLARGVFRKGDCKVSMPTAVQVARAKAQAFARNVFSHGFDAAYRFGLRKEGNKEPTFCTTGRSSTFMYGDTRIHFKGTSSRKVCLGNEQLALAIRALWQGGKASCNRLALSKVCQLLGRYELRTMAKSAAQMPGWLWTVFRMPAPIISKLDRVDRAQG